MYKLVEMLNQSRIAHERALVRYRNALAELRLASDAADVTGGELNRISLEILCKLASEED